MSEPVAPPSVLDEAQARLNGALVRLEARLSRGAKFMADGEEGSRLRADIAAGQARERELEQLAAEASAALGRAAAEVRAALAAEA